MNIAHVTITGSDKTISELEAFLREEKIQVERGAVAVNDATTVGLAVLYIIAKFDIIPKCITAFRASRKAIAFMERALERGDIESYRPKIHRTLGEIYFRCGDKTKALEHLETALLLNPGIGVQR